MKRRYILHTSWYNITGESKVYTYHSENFKTPAWDRPLFFISLFDLKHNDGTMWEASRQHVYCWHCYPAHRVGRRPGYSNNYLFFQAELLIQHKSHAAVAVTRQCFRYGYVSYSHSRESSTAHPVSLGVCWVHIHYVLRAVAWHATVG